MAKQTIKQVEAACEAKLENARGHYQAKCLEAKQMRALAAAWEADARRARFDIVKLKSQLLAHRTQVAA